MAGRTKPRRKRDMGELLARLETRLKEKNDEYQ